MLTLALLAALQSAPAHRVDDLQWMAGCWTSSNARRVIQESWMPPLGGTLLGMSRTVRGAKTSEYEFLLLREANQRVEYVAKPSGQAEAVFTSTVVTNGRASFENPAHDFPTRITYTAGDGTLVATIEGTMNGQPRRVQFDYRRCTP